MVLKERQQLIAIALEINAFVLNTSCDDSWPEYEQFLAALVAYQSAPGNGFFFHVNQPLSLCGQYKLPH